MTGDQLRGDRTAPPTNSAYLDYNATAPVRPEAASAVLDTLRVPGNASSPHAAGQRASALVQLGRSQLAELLRCSPNELVITSGATEANNLALRVAAPDGGQLVVSATEHPAVLEAARQIATDQGCDLTIIGVDRDGQLRLDELHAALNSPLPTVVSIMAANNETGVLNDIQEMAELTRAAGGIFHTDATQLVGRLPLDLSTVTIDMLSLSAHKFGGPQGVGALFLRRGLPVAHRPLVRGGGQERGWRAGTLNVAGIAGMGAAAAAAQAQLDIERERTAQLRDRLEALVLAALPDTQINGRSVPRLPGVSSMTFPGAPADAVLSGLPEVAASDGSACSSGALAPSHVLLAMGRTAEEAESTVRFSLGHATTKAEIDFAAEQVVSVVRRVKEAMWVS
ncbi:aminotransferase [Micromonospora echinospora]|uniref:cysteine desulfurase n=1 Tax=Micromonospora echinospora TaxID=1877 RepID=A0A1C4WGM0_MICEC|nr:cysteine desulfurase family protein [Micromonospora echinospora]OZV72164.1 aminotransferase [Micromonospora echinospora]SCE95365.1 cysteine desulfurase [Micromonospora echinospora]